jgi:cytochrome d ubiquinol oxidase subunit I
VPLYIGGIVNPITQEVSYKLKLPKALSFLAFGDFNAEVKGLNDFPADERPNVPIVHYAFQIMVGIGTLLLMVGILFFLSLKRRSWWHKNAFWLLFTAMAPEAVGKSEEEIKGITTSLVPVGTLPKDHLEAGWVVTEVGRQPWIIYNVMKTKDAVTPVPGMVFSFYMYVILYSILAIAVTWLMRRQIKALNNAPIR